MIKKLYTIHKKKIIIGGVILALMGIVFVRAVQEEVKEESQQEKVASVTLLSLADIREAQSTIQTTGEIEASNQVDMKSEVSGKIAYVSVGLGQYIYKGQVIAGIVNADLMAQLQQARADYDGIRLSMAEYDAQLVAGQAQHEQNEETSAHNIAAAKSALEAAEAQLKLVEDEENSQIVRDAYANLYTAIVTTQQTFANTLNTADSILGVDNSLVNDSYEQVLSVLHSSAKTQAKTSYLQAKRKKQALDTALATVGVHPTPSQLDDIIPIVQEGLEAHAVLFTDMTAVLDNTRAIGPLSQTTLNSLVSSVQTARSSIVAQQTSINTYIQATDTARNSLEQYTIAYEKAERDLAYAEAQYHPSVTASQAQLTQKEVARSGRDTQLRRAQGVINGLYAQINKTVFRSPISGTVAVLPVKTGELLSPGNIVTSIVNTSGLQIKGYINSVERNRIAVGGIAHIGEHATGTITHIAPSIDPTTKKVEVRVAIDAEYIDQFVVGDFVEIVLEESTEQMETNSLLLPLSSVRIGVDGTMVYILDENQVVQAQPVVVDRVMGNMVEVIAGLDNVESIVESISHVLVGDTVKIKE
ncbi:HlyD family efflux transporter periplasmic adaptor subunit [Patescibacteria group bacterium]|nr:HlyD family efflux transporter periplasmic adaptor subunit [Patescibacteria group bacterium]MBU1721845.1 HlyD family efflux transporter periplasmic adaptor subunit [Patescibacteria group bacterium]MBU1901660.1 HlyD family efflux transporter periplasmic adaptor subunit [Patescibacteria group bacterium]